MFIGVTAGGTYMKNLAVNVKLRLHSSL